MSDRDFGGENLAERALDRSNGGGLEPAELLVISRWNRF